jgi:hypothetical protein
LCEIKRHGVPRWVAGRTIAETPPGSYQLAVNLVPGLEHAGFH